MSIWDEIPAIFLPKAEYEKRKEKQYNSAKEQEKKLLEQLRLMEKEYNDSIPKPVEKDYDNIFKKFDKTEREYDNTSQEELKNIAKKNVLNNYSKELEEIKNYFNKSKQNATKNRQKVIDTGKEILENLNQEKLKNDEKINSDMAKRGLYYSSIKNGKLLDNIKNTEQKKSASKLVTNKYLDEIVNTVGNIERDKQKAINNLDKTSSDNYTKLLHDLIDKKNKNNEQVAKYNENIRAEKVKYDNAVTKMINELKLKDKKAQKEQLLFEQEQEKKYGYTGAKRDSYQKRLNLAVEFYNTLPKNTAQRIVKNNPELKSYLGNYYYDLVDIINNRNEKSPIFE